VTVRSEVYSIAAYVRAIPTGGRTLLSDIINLDCVIPSTRSAYVWIVGIPLDTENSVGVTAMETAFFHLEHDTLCMLIVNADVFILSCSG